MTFEVLGDLTEEEKKSLESMMKVVHERISKYKFRRLLYKVDGKVNYVYNIRSFSDRDIVLGINSNSFTSSKDRHILMVDIDMKEGISFKDVKQNLREVQEAFSLPDIHIYKSSKTGYFALCFVDLSYDELLNILGSIKHEDSNHLFCLLKYKFLTLRIQKKREKRGSEVKYYTTLRHKLKGRTELQGARKVFERLISDED